LTETARGYFYPSTTDAENMDMLRSAASGLWTSCSEGPECLRFFDAGLSAGFRFGATVARVGKHD
jgi:hypothetical protein